MECIYGDTSLILWQPWRK